MCDICENYNIGDDIGYTNLSAQCNYCGFKFISENKNTIWIANSIDNHGFLNHQTNIRFKCPECNADGVLGILCTGIEAGELFMQNSEKKENNETI